VRELVSIETQAVQLRGDNALGGAQHSEDAVGHASPEPRPGVLRERSRVTVVACSEPIRSADRVGSAVARSICESCASDRSLEKAASKLGPVQDDDAVTAEWFHQRLAPFAVRCFNVCDWPQSGLTH
jgi:hypothetical protein